MNNTGLYTPDCIRTFTGKYVNVFDPDPDTICIEDIAHSLAHQCRFGGHTGNFYSVAQHSVCVAYGVDKGIALDGLMHDAAEAYLVDLPRPIKRKISEYSEIENNLLAVIAKKFSFGLPLHPQVKILDDKRLQIEWMGLMLSNNIKGLSPTDAKREFLYAYDRLKRV